MLNRTTLTALATGIALVALVGCAPQSRDSFNRYVEALDAVPGVTVDYVGVSTPLPFAVHGTVDVSLDADGSRLAELRAVACETDVNASVVLSITVHAGATSVLVERVQPCERPLIDQVGIAAATESFGVALTVDDEWVGVSDAENLAETLTALRVATDFLPATPAEFDGDRFSLSAPDPEIAAAYLDDFIALVATFQVKQIDLGEGSLVIQVSPASDIQGVHDFLAARDPQRYSQLEILVRNASAGDVPSGTDVVVIELHDRLMADLGLSVLSVIIRANTVYVQAADGPEVVELSEQIAAVNPDAVKVGIGIFEDEEAGIAGFRQREEPRLTPSSNPYPEWVAQYERLTATNLVGAVEVGAGSLEAWVIETAYDDPEAFATVRAVLDDLADEYELTFWGLNNRDLTNG